MKFTREVVLVKDVHPNEEAAAQLVNPLAVGLRREGVEVKIVSLPKEREISSNMKVPWYLDMSRGLHLGRFPREKLAKEVVISHPDKLVVAVHDCD